MPQPAIQTTQPYSINLKVGSEEYQIIPEFIPALAKEHQNLDKWYTICAALDDSKTPKAAIDTLNNEALKLTKLICSQGQEAIKAIDSLKSYFFVVSGMIESVLNSNKIHA